MYTCKSLSERGCLSQEMDFTWSLQMALLKMSTWAIFRKNLESASDLKDGKDNSCQLMLIGTLKFFGNL